MKNRGCAFQVEGIEGVKDLGKSSAICRQRNGQWGRGMKARRGEAQEWAREGGTGQTSQGHVGTLHFNSSALGRGVM